MKTFQNYFNSSFIYIIEMRAERLLENEGMWQEFLAQIGKEEGTELKDIEDNWVKIKSYDSTHPEDIKKFVKRASEKSIVIKSKYGKRLAPDIIPLVGPDKWFEFIKIINAVDAS